MSGPERAVASLSREKAGCEERAALSEELADLQASSDEEIRRLTELTEQLQATYTQETNELRREIERLEREDKSDSQLEEDTEQLLRAKIESMEVAFADRCEEKSNLEKKLDALSEHKAGLEERVSDLKEEIREEEWRFRQDQGQLMATITKLGADIEAKDEEALQLEEQERELCAENEEIAAGVRRNARGVAKARKCLEVYRSALQNSIEGEKHFQARVEGLTQTKTDAAPAQRLAREAVCARLSSASVTTSESPLSPSCCSTDNLDENGNIDHNRMILRLFKQLISEWFAPVTPDDPQKTLKNEGRSWSPRRLDKAVRMAETASKALHVETACKVHPTRAGVILETEAREPRAPAPVRYAVPSSRKFGVRGAAVSSRVRRAPGPGKTSGMPDTYGVSTCRTPTRC